MTSDMFGPLHITAYRLEMPGHSYVLLVVGIQVTKKPIPKVIFFIVMATAIVRVAGGASNECDIY